MFKQQLYIGLNDKDTHVLKMSKAEAEAIIVRALKQNNIDSFTMQYCTGFYKEEREGTIIIEVVDEVLRLDNGLIKLIKFALNQESIMRVVQKVNEVEFV